MSSIWKTCLAKLENDIPTNDFNTWIRPLQAVEKGETLKLLAPNRFIIEHIKQKFISKIEDVVYEFSNGTLLIEFEIGSKSSNPPPSVATKSSSKPNKPSSPKKLSNFLNKTTN